MRNTVAETSPGEKVEVQIFRDGEKKTLEVEIGELEGSRVSLASGQEIDVDLGLTVKNLTSEIARQLGVDEDTTGVVVAAVKRGAVAARAGIAVGDIIVAVSGQEVEDVGQFRALMTKADLEEGVRLQVLRDGFRRFVFLKRAS